MKYIYVAFICLIFPLICLAEPSGWKLSRDANNVKVWLLKSNSDVTGTLEKRKTKNKMDWSKVKEENFFKKLENKKKKMLSLIGGITNWNAEKYSWAATPYQQLSVNGSYIDSDGQVISFSETHIFKTNETIQILHTRPKALKDGDMYEEKIVNYMKKQAGVK